MEGLNMRKGLLLLLIACFIASGLFVNAYSEDIKKEDCFFLSSLHHTIRGMAYWYDKKNGGLETLTGIPYDDRSKLDCMNCHVSSCDVCHKTEKDKKMFYSTKAALNQEMCLNCHKREKLIMKIDRDENRVDVHTAKKMQCMDCHTAREVHGDGTEYNSMRQEGAFDVRCENCHKSVKATTSHKIHGDKLDCKACHVRQVVSCSNCHMGTLINNHKRVDIKLRGWVFLMNYRGKVTSATTQTFVAPGDKTFLMFAPQNSHSIMKDGRKCTDCHANENVRHAEQGKVNLIWLENGEVKHLKGMVPVVENVTYNAVYQNYVDGKWVPIENPKPLLQYVAYGSPLSAEQLKKLAMPMGKK
jgi:hypothetical protein